MAYAYPPLRDRNNRPVFKNPPVFGDDLQKVAIDLFGTHVPKAENHDTRQISPTGRKEIAEIKIMCQQNTCLSSGFFQYIRVLHSMEPFVLKVSRPMAALLEKLHYPGGNAHICQESHAGGNSNG